MKNQIKVIIALIAINIFLTVNVYNTSAQNQERKIPSVTVKTLDGKKFDSKDIISI